MTKLNPDLIAKEFIKAYDPEQVKPYIMTTAFAFIGMMGYCYKMLKKGLKEDKSKQNVQEPQPHWYDMYIALDVTQQYLPSGYIWYVTTDHTKTKWAVMDVMK